MSTSLRAHPNGHRHNGANIAHAGAAGNGSAAVSADAASESMKNLKLVREGLIGAQKANERGQMFILGEEYKRLLGKLKVQDPEFKDGAIVHTKGRNVLHLQRI